MRTHPTAWLPRSVPTQSRTAVIHGDYRIDNLIYAPGTPKIRAVLDWELATIGDPVSDFAYFAMNWILPPDGRSGLGGIDLRSRGLPSLEEVIARYCAAIGLDGLPHLNWYFAFNLFLLVSILQGIRKRALDGNAASAGADSVVARIPTIAALPGSRRALPARPKEGRYELI